MPNFRDWTASEIITQVPQARNIIAKHFGPEGIKTSSGFRLSELARRKNVDLGPVIHELDAAAKGNPLFS